MAKQSIISLGKIDSDIEGDFREIDERDLPLIITRDVVLFPEVLFPINLTRDAAVKVAEAAHKHHLKVGVISQKDPSVDNPKFSDICRYGVIGFILEVFEMPDGTKTALFKTGQRFELVGPGAYKQIPGAPSGRITLLRDIKARMSDKEFLALVQSIKQTTIDILEATGGPEQNDLKNNINNAEDPYFLINLIATHSPLPQEAKQELLAEGHIKKRAFMLMAELSRSQQMAEIMAKIRRRTQRNMEEQQRQAFLHGQIEAIKQELYGDDASETSALSKKAAEKDMPQEVMAIVKREISKLDRLNPQSPDFSVQYNYVETLLNLPWNEKTALSTDFAKAEKILDRDHYGLEKVKERVLEQLAVMMHTPEGRSPIICLVGAPGVGKTSIGKSVAEALGRKYTRVSLGGMHDESEIRGHRRTYIGAMPGRIIDAIRRAGSNNPLMLLDEIDKLGNDFRGDPSAALLEALDPEQNSRFHDNYIDIDYDLSNTRFLATANNLATIPQPLIDRMEIIEMPGYLPEEKREIARRHLIPRALKKHGFGPDASDKLSVSFDSEAIDLIVSSYTAESGVRQLEKAIEKLVRQMVLRRMRGQIKDKARYRITPKVVKDILGPERYSRERYDYASMPGVATGLAWTAVGGEILFIESSLADSKGEKLTLTGNLGDVMKESAMIALQYVRSRAQEFGINADALNDKVLHIHVPEGAIPKDGPSAGITMASSIVSTLTGRPLRKGFAMTGEMTLRGKVLPVGGIKEKVLAAKRAGLTDIVLSKENRKDVEGEIKPEMLEGITFHYVATYAEVFDLVIA